MCECVGVKVELRNVGDVGAVRVVVFGATRGRAGWDV